MVRTPLLDKNGLRKGTWTPEEDRLLKAYIDRYGSWNWRQLPKYAGLSRCGKSCRLRWMNYLRPNIKRGNFSAEEEGTIIKLHNSLGNRWSAIAAELPGRTDNEIKNHWHTKLKKRIEQNSNSHEGKNNTNNLAPFEKRRKRLKQQNDSVLEPPTTQVIDTPPMSPQPSSSGFSFISKDSAAATSSIMVMDDSATSTEAYAETGDSFWTQPFLTESSFVPSVFLEPLADTEYLSPVFDEFFPAYGFAEEKLNSNNLSPREKGQKKLNEPNDSSVNPINTQIVDSSPSSPQPSSSEFSSITRESAAAASTNAVADDNVTSSEAYAETAGNFWTHPFSSDSSYIPSDFLEPFMDTEYLSPIFDEFMVHQMYRW